MLNISEDYSKQNYNMSSWYYFFYPMVTIIHYTACWKSIQIYCGQSHFSQISQLKNMIRQLNFQNLAKVSTSDHTTVSRNQSDKYTTVDHNSGRVHRTVCLLTPQLLLVHIAPIHGGMARLS